MAKNFRNILSRMSQNSGGSIFHVANQQFSHNNYLSKITNTGQKTMKCCSLMVDLNRVQLMFSN